MFYRVMLFGPANRLFEDPAVHIEVTPAAPAQEETEEELLEIADIAEQLALQNIITEERQAEILEKVESCQNRLEQLSTSESPMLTALSAEVAQLRQEIANLKSFMDSKLNQPIPNPSETPAPVLVTEVLEEPRPEESIEEPRPEEALPEPEAQAPPKKKNRFI